MSFRTYARKVRKVDLPFKNRRSAFRSCINSYCGLTKQEFQITCERYSDRFGFNADIPDAGDRLNQAMDALETERNIFLQRLRQFDNTRIKEKIRGRRFPSKLAIEKLYTSDWFAFEIPKNEITTDN